MELQSTSWRRFLNRNLPALGVLALGLVATGWVTRSGWVAAQETDRRRFEEAADNTVHTISARMDAYVGALFAARALFHSSGEIHPSEFHSFVESIELSQRYRGIQGLGFARLLEAEEIQPYQRQMRAQGLEGFRVFPLEPPRAVYSAITLLQPMDLRNRRAVGYDMMSDPVRREAMLQAQNTGQPAASGRVTLIQELDPTQQPGFLIYLSVLDPRDEPVGWVYSPFRAHDLLHAIFPTRPAIDFQVYDGDQVDPAALYFDEAGPEPRAPRSFRTLETRRSLQVAGRRWTVALQSRPELYLNSSRASLGWVPLLGVVASFLLFGVVRLQSRARELSEARERRTAFMAEAGRLLNESLDLNSTLQQLARLSVRSLSDGCLIHLKEESGDFQEVVLVHRDPELTRLGQQGVRLLPREPGVALGVDPVLRTGRSELIPVVPAAALEAAALSSEEKALLRRVQLRSFMCVPMQVRGSVIGAVSFLGQLSGQFRESHLAVAEELGRLAATAVDNSRLYSRAQQAIRIRDEFLSVASHELKTPITSLTLKLDLMKRLPRPSDDPRWRRSEQVMERQLRRLGRLVDSLLDVSRSAAGRLRLDLEELDLASSVREVAASLEEELAATGTGLELKLPPHLIGLWDRMRVEQVVGNLLSNAIKYGEGKPVTLTVEEAGDRARIRVHDRGIGIPAADVERIFLRFERAVPSANYGGLGLGLYISRQIVEALGGTISATSREGEGSTFTVELPRSGPVTSASAERPAEWVEEQPLHP